MSNQEFVTREYAEKRFKEVGEKLQVIENLFSDVDLLDIYIGATFLKQGAKMKSFTNRQKRWFAKKINSIVRKLLVLPNNFIEESQDD